MFVHAHRQPV